MLLKRRPRHDLQRKKSGANKVRPALESCLSHLREGDTLVVWKLDRLGRTTKQLIELVEDLKQRVIQFKSIQDNIDTSTITGEFFFQVMTAFAQLERSMLIERTNGGLAAARARGRKGGRPESISKQKKELAYKMYMERDKTVKEICETVGLSAPTLFKYASAKK